LIVGHRDKTTQVKRHDEEGTGVDAQKELNPGPSIHNGICMDVDQVISHISYELVMLSLVVSNHVISAFCKDIRYFLLSKSRLTMTILMTIPTLFQSTLQWQNHLIMGRTCSVMVPFNTCCIICFPFYIWFCEGLEMMVSDKICTAAHTYVHVLSLCHLYHSLVT
jgi:hypothetical protein